MLKSCHFAKGYVVTAQEKVTEEWLVIESHICDIWPNCGQYFQWPWIEWLIGRLRCLLWQLRTGAWHNVVAMNENMDAWVDWRHTSDSCWHYITAAECWWRHVVPGNTRTMSAPRVWSAGDNAAVFVICSHVHALFTPSARLLAVHLACPANRCPRLAFLQARHNYCIVTTETSKHWRYARKIITGIMRVDWSADVENCGKMSYEQRNK